LTLKEPPIVKTFPLPSNRCAHSFYFIHILLLSIWNLKILIFTQPLLSWFFKFCIFILDRVKILPWQSQIAMFIFGVARKTGKSSKYSLNE